jgi:Ni,Fe-hydrogenase III small subunit
MATPFASKRGRKKVTNYWGLLVGSARKADVLLSPLLMTKTLRKRMKKMYGGEEEKIW